MKLISAVGLAVLVLIALAGCGPKAEGPLAAGDALKVGIVYDKGGLNDKSFNASAARGIAKVKSDLSLEVIEVQSQSDKDYESNLRELADKGCKLVFAIGFNMEKALGIVAKEFPDTKFAIIDGEVNEPNVRSLKFKEEEGSFLVGYLAGLMTKTNKLGFVGGQDWPLIKKFEVGYKAGALTANPAVQFTSTKYTNSWDDIDTAVVAANSLYKNEGADIVYHAAGKAGLGVIRAAKENGKLAIGVDSDQDDIEPGTVLTSMIKRVDNAVFSTAQDMKNNAFTSGLKVYDLHSQGVGTSDFKYTKDLIGEENLKKLDAVRQKITGGEITVPANQEEFEAFVSAMN